MTRNYQNGHTNINCNYISQPLGSYGCICLVREQAAAFIGDDACKYSEDNRCTVICRAPFCQHWQEKSFYEATKETFSDDDKTILISLIRMKDECLNWIIENSSCELAKYMARKGAFATWK